MISRSASTDTHPYLPPDRSPMPPRRNPRVQGPNQLSPGISSRTSLVDHPTPSCVGSLPGEANYPGRLNADFPSLRTPLRVCATYSGSYRYLHPVEAFDPSSSAFPIDIHSRPDVSSRHEDIPIGPARLSSSSPKETGFREYRLSDPRAMPCAMARYSKKSP